MSNRFPLAEIAAAQASQRKWGCYASVSLAQWALESAYGKHMSGKNNPFGIKARTGTAVRTHEQDASGHPYAITATFADYASVAESFDGHGQLVAGKHYVTCRAVVTNNSGPKAYARALQKDGYATDIHYADKLIGIMDANALYQYDAGGINAALITPADRPPIRRVDPPDTPKTRVATPKAGAIASAVVVGGSVVGAAASSATWSPVCLLLLFAALLALAAFLFVHFHKKGA